MGMKLFRKNRVFANIWWNNTTYPEFEGYRLWYSTGKRILNSRLFKLKEGDLLLSPCEGTG